MILQQCSKCGVVYNNALLAQCKILYRTINPLQHQQGYEECGGDIYTLYLDDEDDD